MRLEPQHGRRPHFLADGIRHATINGHRFHLRIGRKGERLLWVDGRQPPYMIDETASDFVSHLIDAMWLYGVGDSDVSAQVIEYVVDRMYRKYGSRLPFGRNRVTRKRIREDLDRLFGSMMAVAETGCPVQAGIEPRELLPGPWSAPARMDLAVTYRCNLKCGKCYLPGAPPMQEMTAEQWVKVLGILWRIGVPQVVFTGGEPTLRPDLVELVSQADEFVTGLVTNGTRLKPIARDLSAASLDYAQVTIESHSPGTHDAMTGVPGSHRETCDGILAALDAGLDVVTNTTLTAINVSQFPQTVRWLHDSLGVENMACNTLICSGKGTAYRDAHGASDSALWAALHDADAVAEEVGLNLQWYSPTCYTRFNPLTFGFGSKSCSAAAHNMTIQPDGSVLPCQSWPSDVGNILSDKWRDIWRHPTCVRLRERQDIPDGCRPCVHVSQCAGGCPLDDSPREATI